jgi:hypothetical protein
VAGRQLLGKVSLADRAGRTQSEQAAVAVRLRLLEVAKRLSLRRLVDDRRLVGDVRDARVAQRARQRGRERQDEQERTIAGLAIRNHGPGGLADVVESESVLEDKRLDIRLRLRIKKAACCKGRPGSGRRARRCLMFDV